MVPPDGFNKGNKVWLLKKSLYGLKQAPRMWYLKLKEVLGELGFTQSEYDKALYLRTEEDGTVTQLAVHVDDMLIINKNKSTTDKIIDELSTKFTITDLGDVHRYLKIDVIRKEDSIFLHQSDYALSVVHKFQNLQKVVAKTPLPSGTVTMKCDSVLIENPDSIYGTPVDPEHYASLVGSLMYLATNTRPDIAYAVNTLCRYMQKPSQHHLQLAQHVIAYLNTTHTYGLCFKASGNPLLYGMCDASFVSDVDTSKSVTGYCFMWHNSVISWKSKLQSNVALSTAESEYMAIASSGKEAVWLQQLMKEISPDNLSVVNIGVGEQPGAKLVVDGKSPEQIAHGQLVYSDSMSAIRMVKNVESTKFTRHIRVIHHWAREQVSEGHLYFDYVKGKENVADIFTKANFSWQAFVAMRDKLGMIPKEQFVK
jgi:histone deacetylase 1/2